MNSSRPNNERLRTWTRRCPWVPYNRCLEPLLCSADQDGDDLDNSVLKTSSDRIDSSRWSSSSLDDSDRRSKGS